MSNKNKTIKQKESGERNKEIWILKEPEGKVIQKFRQLQTARVEKTRLEKSYYGVELILERDNSYTKNLREVLNEKKKSMWRLQKKNKDMLIN